MTSEPTSGRSDRHEVRRTVEDIRQIVLSEYWYWRNVQWGRLPTFCALSTGTALRGIRSLVS